MLAHLLVVTALGISVQDHLDGAEIGDANMSLTFETGGKYVAATVLGLGFSWRYARRVFWIMLPVGMGLIGATVAGRFHYGVDCLCAIPLAGICAAIAAAAVRAARAPEPERRPVPAWRWIT